MNRIFESIQKERLYILLLIFVILINVLIAGTDRRQETGDKRQGVTASTTSEDVFMKREEVDRILSQKRSVALLFSLASLLMLAMLLLGIVIDYILLSLKAAKKSLDIRTYNPEVPRWGIQDVVKVVILFMFFGYMVVIIESLLVGVFPLLKNSNFRMILNSSILDILSVVFIIHLAVTQYKGRLVSLGLSVKNFLKNVFYGIVGYIAAVPALLGTLMVIIFIINITKYVPEKQAVVELFMKEKNVTFLAYTSIFTAIVGPFIEELFFRGFMYGAFKKRIGIFWAMILTSAVFAALHTNVVGFLPIMILGILLAYLYEKTGTLVSSITVHVMHNLSMVFLVFLMRQVQVRV